MVCQLYYKLLKVIAAFHILILISSTKAKSPGKNNSICTHSTFLTLLFIFAMLENTVRFE